MSKFEQEIEKMLDAMVCNAAGKKPRKAAAEHLALLMVQKAGRFDPTDIVCIGLHVFVRTPTHQALVVKGQLELLKAGESIPAFAMVGVTVAEATPDIRKELRKSIGMRLVT